MPDADHPTDVILEIDWIGKVTSVKFTHPEGGFSEWPGLMVQTIGVEEAVFRTRGIPPRFTHWWHVARNSDDALWGLVIAAPDVHGDWQTCPLVLRKFIREV